MFSVVTYLPPPAVTHYTETDEREEDRKTRYPGHHPPTFGSSTSLLFTSPCLAVPCFLSVAAKPLYLSHFGTGRFAPIW